MLACGLLTPHATPGNTPLVFTPAATAQPYFITGNFKVTNAFVLTTYYVENAVALLDMHGFVLRDPEWELPVDSQVLGFMTFDEKTLEGRYELSLPALPRGAFNDVDHDGQQDQGVQIFAVGYSPNLYGGPFAEGDDRSRGWPTYLASIKTDPENHDEVVGGKLIVWSPDAQQQFPAGFGADGLLFTADDPLLDLPAGYSIIDLDQQPFAVIQSPSAQLDLYEPPDVAVKDFSKLSYTQAFERMFAIVRKEYAFADVKGKAPDWDSLYAELKPRLEQAEKDKDANAFYLVLRDFTWAFRDGHVGLNAGDYSLQDFQNAVAGGYGFAIRQLDDGRVLVIYVLEDGPAAQAGIQVGAEVIAFNGQPILQAIDAAHSYALQSSDFAIRYQKARYLLRAKPGEQAQVTFANPGKRPQTVTLTAVAERSSFQRTSLYYGVDSDPLLPVEARVISDTKGEVGYIRINSNYDDLNLVIRLFERALQQFQARKVAGIIIDMRYNNGGANLGLAGFLTDQEIPLGQLEYYSETTGKFEAEGPRQKVLPNQHQYRFDKMVLLVGPACFSACELEAYGFSQVPGMVVVGQYPTAGVEAETARGKFILPEGFELTIPTGRFTLPDGSIFLEGKGVPPTLKVPVDESNAASTEDVVLQAGLQAVLLPLGAGITPSASPRFLSKTEAEDALRGGSSFLEDVAREDYLNDDYAKPGTLTFTISLNRSETLIWGYAWCASTKEILEQNFQNIHLQFVLNGEKVSGDQMNVFDVEARGKQCRLYYSALSDWPGGEHHLSTIATFATPIHDGTSEFPAGDYVLEYTVYVKP